MGGLWAETYAQWDNNSDKVMLISCLLPSMDVAPERSNPVVCAEPEPEVMLGISPSLKTKNK